MPQSQAFVRFERASCAVSGFPMSGSFPKDFCQAQQQAADLYNLKTKLIEAS